LQTAKLNGVDPKAYLADAISRMAKGRPIGRLSDLFPWNWKSPEAKLTAQASAVFG